jgi:translocator protein
MIESWMAIAAVIFFVSLGANLVSPDDTKWFKQLRRPQWLTFEILIPVIWTIILICGGISAYLVWEKELGSSKGWSLMSLYVLLEIVIIAYVPITLRTRTPKLGTLVGLAGFGLGLSLTLTVWTITEWSGLLLVPYLIWSPIGSYTTWAIADLNP